MNNEDHRRAAQAAMAEVAQSSMASMIKESPVGSTLAKVSHTAALAAARLEQAAVGQGLNKTEIATSDLEAIKAMLREIQNAGHLTYLKQHGAEADYQAIGAKIAKLYRTPSGKWRKAAGAE